MPEKKEIKKLYGLIGYPLTHSFSRKFFSEKFERENINAEYLNFEIDNISKFPDILLNNEELVGLNVTIPYKESVIAFLDELDEHASKIGAVNTIKLKRNENSKRLVGFNSDVYGFYDSLKPMLSKEHNRALILGTGGASKAIKYVLKMLDIDYISASIEELKDNEIAYEDIDQQLISDCLIIINSTPLGTYPNIDNCPKIPYQFLTTKHVLFDLVYNPETTLFLKKGIEMGALCKNGLEMLHGQALKSYEIWNNSEF